MMQGRLCQDRDLTEEQIRQIVRSMYEERLSEVCVDQRATPYHADMHSAANRAFVDYFERLTRSGGHMSFLPAEERQLTEQGWDPRRIADLKMMIAMREDRDVSPIRRAEIDRHLASLGLPIDDLSRWKVELALYPAYRDVYTTAVIRLLLGSRPVKPGIVVTAGEPLDMGRRIALANDAARTHTDVVHLSFYQEPSGTGLFRYYADRAARPVPCADRLPSMARPDR